MTTVLTRSPRRASEFIRAGEVVAFPTETVYGLGADVYQEAAIRQIFRAKGRPADNPLIVHLAELSQLAEVAGPLAAAAEKLIAAFFPGPLTVVVPKHESIPALATGGLTTVGVRMPRHVLARQFLRACGTPVVAPSANLSGRPSPTTWRAVAADLDGRISCILRGGQTEVGLESTVVDCTSSRTPLVLRAGAITLEELQKIVPAARLAADDNDHHARRKSPGTRYKHYSPRAGVRVVAHPDEAAAESTTAAAYIGLDAPAVVRFRMQRVCRGVAEYAHDLFDFFRRCDENKITVIYCQGVAREGLGLALMDRIGRAAEVD